MINKIKDFIKKNKYKLSAGVIIVLVLTVVFVFENREQPVNTVDTVKKTERVKEREKKTELPTEDTTEETVPEAEESEKSTENVSELPQEMPAEKKEQTPVYENSAAAEPKSAESGHSYEVNAGAETVPTEVPVPKPETETELSCTLSITCDTILKNIDKFNPDKLDILPEDGVIYAEREVVFYEGESVFNVLKRETKQNRIHFEFTNTPIYETAYVEGIANIYEFDCGELSGWMYKVNGVYPGYGCSRYKLTNNDKIEVVYTCDLGNDVGGGYAPGNGR